MNRCACLCILLSLLALSQGGRTPSAVAAPAAPSRTAPSEAAPAVATAEPPTSFHGIAWGTPLSEITGMAVVEKNGPAAYAKVAGVSPRIAQVDVSDIVYAFCDDRFAGAMATFQGRDRLAAIREVVARRYGQPVAPGDATENVGWPMGDVLIMLEFDALVGVGVLSYLHTPTYAPCTGGGEPGPAAEPPSPTGPADGTGAQP